MTEDAVIRADNLGKTYIIGHEAERERYVALRDILVRDARNAWRKTTDMVRGHAVIAGDTTEEFWALRHINFEIKRGEVVGIIGRNGAGKSTLLKILSRITEPSEGRVVIKGRLASLLEVGTGFHPELTGRENIYLNGSILGMPRAEIRRKFDEIVAFADVEKFLDTPVKRYSSGMYVRLAFAVAAHLEPDILVVDEVLAVGDADFQKKCLGKMSEVAGGGRTVLFVSHNMSAIQTLCARSMCLHSGALVGYADTEKIISAYLQQRRLTTRCEKNRSIKVQEGLVIERVLVMAPPIYCGNPADIEIVFRAETSGQVRECVLLFYSAKGVRIAIVDVRELGVVPLTYKNGRFAIIIRISDLPLVDGEFALGLYLVTDHFAGNLLELDYFDVIAPRSSQFSPYSEEARGVLILRATASIVSLQPPAMAS